MSITYDSTIVKVTKDGETVVSNVLEKGERLIDGTTYRDEEVRLGRVNTPSPFAQGTLTEHNTPDSPSKALTLDSTQTNTLRVGDDENATGEQSAPSEAKHIATLTDDGNSTQVVTPDEDLLARETNSSSASETKYIDPPRDSDSKQEWYDYATKHKGLTAKYDEITKNEIISFSNKS